MQTFVKLISETLEDNSKFSEDEQKNYFTDNIIKLSCYLASLFHDIGYPVVANMEGNRNIMEYIFETYNLNDFNVDFNKITALLGNSLLFRVESIKKIKKRLQGNEEVEQKIDHGAVSAIVFLLHFYENGAIHRLEPYKICAVELAGLAIYNHTNEYRYTNQEEQDYERSVFFQNPISHLLRVSDDMQEWGRIYFQITDNSNLILCDKCKTPIVRVDKGEEDKYLSYWCHCCQNDQDVNFKRAFSEEGFSYRRIYKVTICDELEIKWDKEKWEEHIYLNYDLNRLLHIAYIFPAYAKYRGEEIEKLKRLFLRQFVPYHTYIHTFMSANIIAIKSEIVGEKLQLKEELENLYNEIAGILKNETGEEFSEIFKKIESYEKSYEKLEKYKNVCVEIEKIRNTETETYLKRALNQYAELYFWMYIISIYNDFSLIDKRDEKDKKGEDEKKEDEKKEDEEEEDEENRRDARIVELEKWLEDTSKLELFEDENTKFLVQDYIRYAERRFMHLEEYPYYPERYLKEFDSDERLYGIVNKFCKTDSYIKGFPEKGVDAYSDLYLFQILEQIKDDKKHCKG